MPTPHVSLEISSSIDMLALVDGVTEQFGAVAGLDGDAVYDLAIAVREAVANAIMHGNAADPSKHVSVAYAIVDNGANSTSIVIHVNDEGSGFDVGSVKDPLAAEHASVPSGRGLMLMRALVDAVDVHGRESGGTEVVMTKKVPSTPASAV